MADARFSKETFWSLLNKNRITIPIIQRSYIQGGRQKGDLFCERLCEALLQDDKPIELDFIYGSTDTKAMYPLDGQQRLTTLFLLHWYVAQKEDKLTEEIGATLARFVYESRVSSQYFCENLCNYKVEDYYQESISKTIRNKKWFVPSWENDPTVASMLGMLEKIDEQLRNETAPLWDTLTQRNVDLAPISFFYTPLDGFNLSDDLYIKMNARGKQLTGFENIKAAFNKRIDDEKWDDKKALAEKFGLKIDTEWTDLFWQFRDENNNIDDYLLRFISAVLVNHYASINDERAGKLFKKPDTIRPADLDAASYDYLYNNFEWYKIANERLKDWDLSTIAFWIRDDHVAFKNFKDLFGLFIVTIHSPSADWLK
ncbi:hypothetical protein FACS1894200_10770 [Spirochaetia bacterium]|nr:hypothetical protein FACS1894200_10770 [Spirochaetia bacterium]